MQVVRSLLQFLSDMGKFLIGVFGKTNIEPTPTPVPGISGVPTVNPSTQQPSTQPMPVIQHGPQSPWWDGVFHLSQPWGCTHFPFELHNPNHPLCDFWHDGEDYALLEGTAIYAGGNFVVFAVDDPKKVDEFGTAALGLIAGTQGHPEGHDVWLLHMQRYAVKYGDSVQRGTLLGYSGHRGRATGPHLHFQAVPRGGGYFSSIDPEPWVHMRG